MTFVTPRRFQVDDLSPSLIRVRGAQAGHALRVLRLKIGASVILFDGRGGEVVGRVRSADTGGFDVEVVERKGLVEPRGMPLLLAVAIPKGPRGDWLVEKCGELGVHRLWPLACERGQVEPGEGKLARWRRKVVEAAKQSGQASVMVVGEIVTIAQVLLEQEGAASIFYGEPHRAERSLADELREVESRMKMDSPLMVLIGPEGGFTDDECRQIESKGGRAVRLAPTVLRIETAAVAVAAIWACGAVSSPNP